MDSNYDLIEEFTVLVIKEKLKKLKDSYQQKIRDIPKHTLRSGLYREGYNDGQKFTYKGILEELEDLLNEL